VTARLVVSVVPAVPVAMVVLPGPVALPLVVVPRVRSGLLVLRPLVVLVVSVAPVVPGWTPQVCRMVLRVVTRVPVVPVVRVALRGPGVWRLMAALVVPVARRGLRVWVRRGPRVRRVRRGRVTGLWVVSVVRAATVAMVVPGVPVALRPVWVLRVRRVRWVRRAVVRSVVRAVLVVLALTRRA
jgi:hypothetical protein